ncbi:hypothetical protein BC828DRAFT_374479 [Blastocladiella britannica]|nr:hypothetical protein BC828DRAFT_374479 [Blastocladiella britannica]
MLLGTGSWPALGLLLVAVAIAAVDAAPTTQQHSFSTMAVSKNNHQQNAFRPLVERIYARSAANKERLLANANNGKHVPAADEWGVDVLAWDKLAELTDTYGPRPGGSQALESALDMVASRARAQNLSVHFEQVPIPTWNRGPESATLTTETLKSFPLAVVGLGFTAPTPPEGINAEVVVVASKEELDSVGAKGGIRGKIAVIAFEWTKYSDGSLIRQNAGVWAEKWGAVAVLIRSVTPYSMRTPHTGASTRASIPAAALAVEDAHMLQRQYERSQRPGSTLSPPRVHLTLANSIGQGVSRNLVIEVLGSVRPDEIVVIGGHLDSWELGVGAADDADGYMVMHQALQLLLDASERNPDRTVRLVAFTAEEYGLYGGHAYFAAHKHEKVVAAIESDEGVFEPGHLSVGGATTDAQFEALASVAELIREVGGRGGEVRRGGNGGPDVGDWCAQTLCGAWDSATPSDVYFRYHHTAADVRFHFFSHFSFL